LREYVKRRLERLEAASPARCECVSIDPAQQIMMGLVAHYGGGWQEHDSLMSAWARALGYDRPGDLKIDLERNDVEVTRRDSEARRALFAARGVDLGRTSWDETTWVIARLIDQVPEDLRVRFGIQEALQAMADELIRKAEAQ
jgi:hypothetical protein